MTLALHGLANGCQGLDMLHHVSDTGEKMPFSNRGDTMFMDVVRPKDTQHGKIRCIKDEAQGLRTHDIEGAKPTYNYKAFHRSGPPEKDPILGSLAATRYPGLNRPRDLSLTSRDINAPGESNPSGAFTARTNRHTNPLMPRYDLPSFKERPATPPGVRMHEGRPRDSMEFTGQQKSRGPKRDPPRDPNEHRDIEYSQGNLRGQLSRSAPRDIMRTVEKAGERILSTKRYTPRVTCPLEPEYSVHQTTTHPFLRSEGPGAFAPREAGRIAGSVPRVLHRDNGEPQASLICSDVPGAVPQRYKGGIPFNMYDPPEVTPYAAYSGLDCSDIPGGQTGTRKPGTL